MLGDLRTVCFARNSFDIIYSAYVLEHVPQTERVLLNFLDWIKPGGLIILKFPDRNSVYGFITRLTPHWVHILVQAIPRGQTPRRQSRVSVHTRPCTSRSSVARASKRSPGNTG